jgi:hypothetical protein
MAISDVLHASSYPCLSAMNFTAQRLEPLDTKMNWLHTEPGWEPGTVRTSCGLNAIRVITDIDVLRSAWLHG